MEKIFTIPILDIFFIKSHGSYLVETHIPESHVNWSTESHVLPWQFASSLPSLQSRSPSHFQRTCTADFNFNFNADSNFQRTCTADLGTFSPTNTGEVLQLFQKYIAHFRKLVDICIFSWFYFVLKCSLNMVWIENDPPAPLLPFGKCPKIHSYLMGGRSVLARIGQVLID